MFLALCSPSNARGVGENCGFAGFRRALLVFCSSVFFLETFSTSRILPASGQCMPGEAMARGQRLASGYPVFMRLLASRSVTLARKPVPGGVETPRLTKAC